MRNSLLSGYLAWERHIGLNRIVTLAWERHIDRWSNRGEVAPLLRLLLVPVAPVGWLHHPLPGLHWEVSLFPDAAGELLALVWALL